MSKSGNKKSLAIASYGNYSKYMHAIIPDGEKTVSHNTLGKNNINPKKIFNKFIKLIN